MTSQTPTIHEHRFRAMGSQIGLWLEHADAAQAQAALQQAQALFDAAERRMTRFDPESELSQLNTRAGQWAPVSRLLWRVIGRAVQLAQETGGLFDPTVGNAVLASGYVASFDESRRSTGAIAPVEPQPLLGQWRSVELDPAGHAVRLPRGVRLDLGGIGKGYAAQQVVDQLSLWGPCLVDAGGDVTAGDGPAGQPGWPVGIARPSQDGSSGTELEVWLNNATLATSGVDYRWWLRDGRRRHHLIDPRTGDSAITDVVTATVLAADASAAEAWATAMLIGGSRQALARSAERQLPIVLVSESGQVSVSPAMERFVVRPAYVVA